MEKLKSKNTESIHSNSQIVADRPVSKRVFSLLGFFSSAKSGASGEGNGKNLLKDPAKEPVSRSKVSNDVSGVKKWVGLEEKTIQDYKKKSFFSFKKADPSIKTSMPEKPAAPDAFIAQTVTLSPLPLSGPVGSAVKKKKLFLRMIFLLLVLGGLLVQFFSPAYVKTAVNILMPEFGRSSPLRHWETAIQQENSSPF